MCVCVTSVSLQVKWLKYWVVLAVLTYVGYEFEALFAWLPLGHHLHLLVLIWLQLPYFRGAPRVFDAVGRALGRALAPGPAPVPAVAAVAAAPLAAAFPASAQPAAARASAAQPAVQAGEGSVRSAAWTPSRLQPAEILEERDEAEGEHFDVPGASAGAAIAAELVSPLRELDGDGDHEKSD